MARSRNIKPGFFKNEDLAECSAWARLCFAGLWTLADRDGRLEDRPKRIKGELFPYDSVEVDALITELVRYSFVTRYEINGAKYIQVANWTKHQNPHHTEKASEIPGIDGEITVKAQLKPKDSPKQDGGYLADSLLLIPDSLIPDSLDSVPKGTAADAPKITDPVEIIFGYGVPMLTNAGTPEKQARSFLGGLRKQHGDSSLINVLRDCIKAKPLQPLEWLAAALPPAGHAPKLNAQEALEASNRAVAQRFLAKRRAIDANA